MHSYIRSFRLFNLGRGLSRVFLRLFSLVFFFYLFLFIEDSLPRNLALLYRATLVTLAIFTITKLFRPGFHFSKPSMVVLIKDVYLGIFWALTLALHIKFYLFQVFTIEYQSMTPTLLPGQIALVEKASFGLRKPEFFDFSLESFAYVRMGGGLRELKQKDIIVFFSPDNQGQKTYIKRILALPKDRIGFNSLGQPVVNGTPVKEEYLSAYSEAHFVTARKSSESVPYSIKSKGQVAIAAFRDGLTNTTEVPANMYFVLGDNRNASVDSRYWGFVPKEYIIGRLIASFKVPAWLSRK